MTDRRYEDDRGKRRDRAGAGVGAVAGGALGALLGLAAPLFGEAASVVGVAVVGLAGAAVGSVLGRRVSTRVSLDEWDPDFARRPHVGARAPDDTPGTAEPPPRSERDQIGVRLQQGAAR